MQKTVFNINVISIAFISLVLLASLWNRTVFYLPILLITGIIGIIDMRNNPNTIHVSGSTILIFLLLLYEIVNFLTSSYQANSILFLRDFIIVVNCIFLIEKLLINKKYQIYFIVFISLMAGLFSFFNIPIFFIRYYESTIYGFSDFTQFRFLYMPFGLFSNEWVTILFCFLPFPLIGLFLFQKKTWVRSGFLLIIGLIVFNIFISFSRAGILAFLLFVWLLNLLFYFNRIFSIKKILLYNAILIPFVILFAFCFSESILSSVYQTNSHQRSTEGRFKQWKEVSTLTYTYPFWGIGSKNYALMGRQSQQMNLENSFTGRLNNTYIQLVVEKGWIGLLVWLCIIGLLLFRLFLQIRKDNSLLDKVIDCILFSVILAILFKEIFFSSLLYNSGILLLFFILLIFNNKTDGIIKIQKYVVIAFVAIFILGALYFYFKRTENALLYATKGIDYERSIDAQIPYHQLNLYSRTFSHTDNETVSEAIRQYKEACSLSPYDAMFQHNLGWLYWMNQQPDSALIYLSQAVKSEPNIALYYVSKGLIIESQNIEKAFESYMQAVLLSPDIIDSPFFIDLKKRSPAKTRELLVNASSKLLQILSNKYSSIIEAKSGKLLLSLGEIDQAYETLLHVTQIHPNLSRPWYYLGFIEQKKGNFGNMQNFYKKSIFLSPLDHLPFSGFASYYKEIGDKSKFNAYSKHSEKALNNKSSVHSIRCRYLYSSTTEKDNVIPKGLLDYITPVCQIQAYDQD